MQVAGKAAQHTEPHGTPSRTAVLGHCRPGEGERDGHDLRARLVAEVHELGKQTPGAVELEAELAAQGQVVRQGLAQGAHAIPPGHGWATADSEARSTLA